MGSTLSNSATPTAGISGSRLQSAPASARDSPSGDGAAANNKADGKQKKKTVSMKDKEKDDADGDGERPAKRGKISWGRD